MRSLRNRFAKATKPKPSGSAQKIPSKKTQWLIDKLQFLAPYGATNRTSVSNLSSPSPTPTVCDNESFGSGSVMDDDCLDDEDLDGEDNNTDDDALNADDKDDEGDTTRHPTPSTKRPTATVKSSRRRQAEEEYNIIKTLAQRVAQKSKTREKPKENLKDATEYFGRYVLETLAELEPRMKHIAQHKINEILFQAQSGTLGTSITHQPNFNWPYQQHPYHSQPPPQQFYYSSQQTGDQINTYGGMQNTSDTYLDEDHTRLLHL